MHYTNFEVNFNLRENITFVSIFFEHYHFCHVIITFVTQNERIYHFCRVLLKLSLLSPKRNITFVTFLVYNITFGAVFITFVIFMHQEQKLAFFVTFGA